MTERRENIARALHDADVTRCFSEWETCPSGAKYRRLADAAIAADDGAIGRVLRPFEELFAGGPDTACRTTWIPDPSMPDCSAASIECVEVPMADLRAAFDAARAVGAPATAEDGTT